MTEPSPGTNPDVTMYSTVWCGYCQRLKTQLGRAGISWVEVNIEADPGSADMVRQLNGGHETVPTVVFADGSALTNPSLKDISGRLAALR